MRSERFRHQLVVFKELKIILYYIACLFNIESMLTQEGWTIEGKDERGTYLIKEIKLPDSNTKVTVRCAIIPTLRPSICLRMFSVAPLKPDEADIIASLFSGSIVWYYRDEEGGKVYFWAKSPDKVRFVSLNQLEKTILSSIQAGISGTSPAQAAYEDLVNEGWLLFKKEWVTEARRSIKMNNKLIIVDIMIDKGERDVMIAYIKIFGLTNEEGLKYKEKANEITDYSVEIFSTFPLFHMRLIRHGVIGSKEESLIREVYNFVIEMVKE